MKGQEGFGSSSYTTNNIMELTALIEAVQTLWTPQVKLNIFSDSMYVVQGVTQWCNNWAKNDWKTSKGDAVKNQHLWKTIYNLIITKNINLQWVKGHSGDEGNEEADRLATVASGADYDVIYQYQKKYA